MKKLTILFFIMILPMVAWAYTVKIDGIYYNLISKGNIAEVTRISGEKYSGNVVIPASVTYDGIYYDVTSIGYSAFLGCNYLSSVTIPKSIVSIGDVAFKDCSGLMAVYISDLTAWCNISISSLQGSNPLYYAHHLYLNGEEIKDLVIPDDVTTIKSRVFIGCSGLTSVTISNSVTSIDERAFSGCTGLTTVTISESVKTIGSYAFASCSSLTSVIIPNGLETIGENAFGWCDSLTTITIPNSVTSIGAWAFYHCDALTSVTLSDNITSISIDTFDKCISLSSITIPNGVTSIGGDAFDECRSLTSITIPNSVTFIGSRAFANCSGLTSITIPNSVTSIENETFYRCEGLLDITIGSGIKIIGYRSFGNCSGLTDVTCLAEEVPNTNSSAFEKSYIEFTTLHVLPASVNAYKASEPWKNFKNIVKIDVPMHSLTYILDGLVYKTDQIEEGATITPEPDPVKEGYTFSGWSDIPATMPAHDVTVTGSFTINKYKLTYFVDGVEYKSYELDYDSNITPEPVPTKEGYTFSGWSAIPETMPAHDVTVTGSFTVNKYKLTYIVDDVEYKSYDVEYGATITPEPAPTKEGHTFSGWSGIPETMPAHDVTVTGSFTVNKYKLTYIVDDVEYKSYEILYGATITPEPAPTKEGYTFSGWSLIPETMPAHDVTVTGSFTINKYKLTYMIDDRVYKEVTYKFGETIIPEPQPEGNYETFQWVDLPATMPAHDVIVRASYTLGVVEMLMTKDEDVRIYSPEGKRLNAPQKGINIIHKNNGQTVKVVIK